MDNAKKVVPVKTAIRILPFRENGKTDYLIFFFGEEEFKAWRNGVNLDTLEFTAFGINGHTDDLESLLIEMHDGVPKFVQAFL